MKIKSRRIMIHFSLMICFEFESKLNRSESVKKYIRRKNKPITNRSTSNSQGEDRNKGVLFWVWKAPYFSNTGLRRSRHNFWLKFIAQKNDGSNVSWIKAENPAAYIRTKNHSVFEFVCLTPDLSLKNK